MTRSLLAWAKDCRASLAHSLKGLRSGVLATSELRDGRRVDTTLESIADRKRELAELDEAIIRHESGRS